MLGLDLDLRASPRSSGESGVTGSRILGRGAVRELVSNKNVAQRDVFGRTEVNSCKA